MTNYKNKICVLSLMVLILSRAADSFLPLQAARRSATVAPSWSVTLANPLTTMYESKSTNDATTDESSESSAKSRVERIKEELTKANGMKVGEMKKELEARGISTRSFFEKIEFVRAYAEAIVDNVSNSRASAAGSSSSSKNNSKQSASRPDEPFDPSYRDVSTQKFNARDPRLLSGVVIDVTPRR
ncbi:hypothetical protein MPSEU_000642800 [Mayamaea pseudoterrestris]|nr:hypothetical protein MPSEU_000642800 [Mayamaea pseudoterrestris]